MPNISSGVSSGALLKENLASELRQAIIDGRLSPDQRVVEGKWAKEFGVAQASVREAINLLIAEGFLVKDAGRSARVVNYRERDVTHIYQVRAALEGLAAQLACAPDTDLSALDSALVRLENAIESGNMPEIIRSDLNFHIALVETPGNPLLAEMGRKLLFPLFAFVEMRVRKSGQSPEAWKDDLQHHRRIVQIIRDGNPNLASQFVQHCIGRFVISAYSVWENVGGSVQAHHQRQPADAQEGNR